MHPIRAASPPSGKIALVRPIPLPIDPWIPEILARVREKRAAVVMAAPGAGKTTRVSPALVPDGPVIVLQPRRVAARSYLAAGLNDTDEQFLRRLRFAGFEVDLQALVAGAARGARSFSDIDLGRDMAWQKRQDLDRLAPERLTVPSGRSHRLDYQADGTVSATVKLQELFGLADTPRIGGRAEPVLLVIAAPNGRPVQMTRDLRSFWARTYPEVRKELRGRYPKHPWPEDPWTAAPTARTKPRGRT